MGVSKSVCSGHGHSSGHGINVFASLARVGCNEFDGFESSSSLVLLPPPAPSHDGSYLVLLKRFQVQVNSFSASRTALVNIALLVDSSDLLVALYRPMGTPPAAGYEAVFIYFLYNKECVALLNEECQNYSYSPHHCDGVCAHASLMQAMPLAHGHSVETDKHTHTLLRACFIKARVPAGFAQSPSLVLYCCCL